MRRPISVVVLVVLAISLFAQPGPDGDFFIVSSIDLKKQQILLKRPTEVTELMGVDGGTRYFEGDGKTIRLTDLRAGDTVYIVSKSRGVQAMAVSIRKGPMTQNVLRERYLKATK